MGDVGKEIGFQRLDTAQLRHHFVEIQDHVVHVVLLVGAVDGRDVDGKVPARHLPGGLGDLLQGLFIGASGEPGDQEGHPRRNEAPVEYPVKKEGEVDHAFKWPLTLPVGVKGVYISFNQSNYDIDGYEWSQVVGTTDRVNGDNIGKLFVSFDNNPVTPYIRNVYRLPQPGPVPDDPGDIIDPVGPGDVEIEDPDIPLASAIGLNDVEHMAYIVGYDDGTVRPLANITRAEVATIFFRLMTDVYRAINWSTTNDFSDVNEGDWYNNAVSTCANAEIMTGYADGTFLPNKSVTRAEFVAIAAQFLGGEYTGEGIEDFTDTAGHWAAGEIRRCVEAGWVTTEEETFRPDDLITRAEVMTIVNRMLRRTPHEDHMIPAMKTWVDNPKGTDYYEAVQEATNEHEYERDGDEVESWINLLEMRDWAALEKEWSTANSGK